MTEEALAVPDGIAVSVYQTRTDVVPRRLEVSFQNLTGGPLTITGVRFSAAQFVETAVWEKDSTVIPNGATVDLPVSLPAPDCDASSSRPFVEFDYLLNDGTSGTARTEADDRLDRLPSLQTEDCLVDAVADVADLSLVTPPRVGARADRPVVELDVTVRPSGASGTLTLVALSSTTLLSPADPATGQALTSQPLDVTIAAGDKPSVVTLLLTPGRCDPHAIAEDKRGTVMPFDVVVDGPIVDSTAGRVAVPSSDEVRGALYAFVTAACG